MKFVHIFLMLDCIFNIALRAYWKNDQDCGSDFDKTSCKEDGCKHFDVCEYSNQYEQYKKAY